MKHALIITTIGGFLSQFEMNDVKILQENGYTVHYASNFKNPVYDMDEKKLQEMGLVLHHIDICKSPFCVIKNAGACLKLKKIIKKEQIQLVHCHNPMGGVLGRLAALLCRRRVCVIYTAHGFHFYKGAPKKNWLLYGTAERLLAHCTDRLITINREDYENAKRFGLRRGGKVESIPGVGVNIVKFRKIEELRSPKRQELAIPKGAFHVVSVGELNENKNHRTVIRAIARLGGNDIYYSICGRGPLWDRLQEEIEALGLEQRVRLLGYRTDVAEVLQSADCFAFPSKREGLGIAAIEALACEVPMVAADNRGTREYVRDGENGIVCDADSEQDFADAIYRLKESETLRLQLAEGCRVTAEHFSIEATDKIMRRIYGEVDREWGKEHGTCI